MIDFIKFRINVSNQKELIDKLAASGWEIIATHNHTTNAIIEYPIEATKGKLTIKFKSPNFIEFGGSLHKFSQGGINHENFPYSALLQILIYLYDTLGINPFTSPIRHLEFGVNISPSFVAKEFLKRIINYKGTNFQPMPEQYGVSLGIVCERSQIKIKIYCKKTQYELPNERMRIEIKAFKMQWLKGSGAKMLIDLLNPFVWFCFGKKLEKMFDELIIIDNSINLNELTADEQQLMNNWGNPLHLERQQLENRKIFEEERRTFREIIRKHSKDNQQQQVINLIHENVNHLLNIDDITFSIFTDFINNFKTEEHYHFYRSISKEDWKPIPPLPNHFAQEVTGEKRTENITKSTLEKTPLQVGKIGKGKTKESKKLKEPKVNPLVKESLLRPESKIQNPTTPLNWDTIISELQSFFESTQLPTTPLKLDAITTIIDASKFVSTHLSFVNFNKGKVYFEPYISRLIKLKEILSV